MLYLLSNQKINSKISFKHMGEDMKLPEQIKESETLFRTLFMTSRDAMMTLEPPSWKFTRGNPAALKMFGAKNEEEFTSAEPWKLSPEKQSDGSFSSEKAKEMIKGAMREGTYFFRWTHRRLNGDVFPATVLLTKVNINGNSFLQATVRDITDQTKAEENEKFLDSIIENIPNMIFVKDAKDLRFIRFNKAGEELLGYRKEDLIGKNDYDFFSKEEADFFTQNDQKVLTDKKLLDIPQEKISTKYKGERILHTKRIPIIDESGESIYLLGISEDITEKMRAINELEKMNMFMVDRELKMIELKKENEKLKEELQNK